MNLRYWLKKLSLWYRRCDQEGNNDGYQQVDHNNVKYSLQ